jgi:hypothetical protein
MARVEQYLPVGTVVTARPQGGKAIEWTTKREVTIADHVQQDCPLGGKTKTLTGTFLRDRQCTVSGVEIWFSARSLRQRIAVDKWEVCDDAYNHQLTKIDYDIPTSLGQAYAVSVAAELHKIGVRSSNSCWFVRTGDTPYYLLGEMEEMGVRKVSADRIDPSETKKLIARMIVELSEQVEKYVRGANETLVSATAKLQESQENGIDEEKAVNDCLIAAKALEKRLEKYKEQMLAGANKLGIRSSAWNADRLSQIAQVTGSELRKRAAAYKRAADILVQSTDTDLHAAGIVAQVSALPAGVMADILREAGHESAAEELTAEYSLLDTLGD